jgi:hypothetical protein
MNTKVYLIAIAFAAGLFFTACNKEETPAKPVINILELGEGDSHGNDHTAKIGGELHIEAEITAEGKIDKVSIRLHPEGDHDLKTVFEGWELDTTYTKFSGLKNTLFHEHVEIDSTALPGDYHFDFVVTDMEGNQSSAEADVVIVE